LIESSRARPSVLAEGFISWARGEEGEEQSTKVASYRLAELINLLQAVLTKK